MSGRLLAKMLGGTVAVVAVMAALLLLPTWTVGYWQAWAFLGVFGLWGTVTVVYLGRRDPALLARRASGGPTAERRTGQRVAMSIMSLGFAALLVVPAVDHRLGWSSVPAWVSIAADVLIAVGLLGVLRVFRENTFTSATIEVADDHRVVSTGPYALVRHPMYAASLLYIVCMPVALGSWWGLLVIVPLLPAFVWRLFDEEGMLKRDLAGYTEYTERVRYRLIPHVW